MFINFFSAASNPVNKKIDKLINNKINKRISQREGFLDC